MEDLLATLKSQLKSAVRNHRRALLEFPSEVFYGYSLSTDGDVVGIQPVANSESSIGVPASDPSYIMKRFGPQEWQYFGDLGTFDDVNRTLTTLSDSTTDFETHRQAIFGQAFEAMRELELEGLFGSRDAERFVVIWVVDSDCSIMDESARALNSPEAYERYASEYHS